MGVDGLTESEAELVECARAGRIHLAAGKDIRASVIRQLLVDPQLSSTLDPHGVRVSSATIIGLLDLELVSTHVALELRSCIFRDQVVLVGGRLSRIVL